MNPPNISVAPEFFVLAGVALAFEYYLGVLLYSTPIMGRLKGWGVSLMRGSVEPMFFLFMMNCLFAFLMPFEGDIWATAQQISEYAINIKSLMISYQMVNYQIMADAGAMGFFTSLMISIARWIYSGGSVVPNPLQIISAGTLAAENAATVLAPVSSIYGTAIVVQTFLGAFAQMLVYNMVVFVNIGVILYIMPLRITRGTGKTLIGFSLMGYALLPLYLQLQTFVSDWMNAALQGQWFSGIASRLQPLQVGVLDVLVPALYFGFLIWLVGAVAGGDVIGRISSRAGGGVSLMTPAQSLMNVGKKAIGVGSGKVQGAVKGVYKTAKARKAYTDAKTQVNAAVMAGKTKGGIQLAQKHLAMGMKFYHMGMIGPAATHFNQALANVKTAREPTKDELDTDLRYYIRDLSEQSPGVVDEMLKDLTDDEHEFYEVGPDDEVDRWHERKDRELSELDQKTERVQTLFNRTMGITPKSIVERRKQKRRVAELAAAYRAKYRSGQITQPELKLKLYSLRLSEGKVDGMIAEDDREVEQNRVELSAESEADTRQPEFLASSGEVAAEVDKYENDITALMNRIRSSNWQDEKSMDAFAEEMESIDKWMVVTTNYVLARRVKAFQAEFKSRSKAEYDAAAQRAPSPDDGMSPEEENIAVAQSAESVLSSLQRRIEASIRRGSPDKKTIEQYDKFVREGLDPHSPLAHKAKLWERQMGEEMDQQARGRGPPQAQRRPSLGSEESTPSDKAEELLSLVSGEEAGRKLREEKHRDKAKVSRRRMPIDQPGSKDELMQQLRRGVYSSEQPEAGLSEEEASPPFPAEVPEAQPTRPEPASKKEQESAEKMRPGGKWGFDDSFYDRGGWKCHFSLPNDQNYDANVAKVKEWLSKNVEKWKYWEGGGGQKGGGHKFEKDFTIYLGPKRRLDAFVKFVENSEIYGVLGTSMAGGRGDAVVGKERKIGIRFDAGGLNQAAYDYWTAASSHGIPINSDIAAKHAKPDAVQMKLHVKHGSLDGHEMDRLFTPEGLEEARQEADELLSEKYGEYYTGKTAKKKVKDQADEREDEKADQLVDYLRKHGRIELG